MNGFLMKDNHTKPRIPAPRPGQAYKTQDTRPPPLPSLINYFFDKFLNFEPFIFGSDYVDGRKKLVAENEWLKVQNFVKKVIY